MWVMLTTFSPFRDLACQLLQMIPDNEILLAKLCAFFPGSRAEIDELHERVNGQLSHIKIT